MSRRLRLSACGAAVFALGLPAHAEALKFSTSSELRRRVEGKLAR